MNLLSIGFSSSLRYFLIQLMLYLVLGGVFWPAHGEELEEAAIVQAVQTWLRCVTADKRQDAVIEKLDAFEVHGTEIGYVAHLQNGGFCLCGADSMVLPVYFYSPRGTYKPDSPGCKYVMWEIAARTRMLRKWHKDGSSRLKQFGGAFTKRASLWQDLSAGQIPTDLKAKTHGDPTSGNPDEVVLALNSHWHQDSPYNDQCPNVTTGLDERCVTGCAPLAMAQIMYYWKWPDSGQGISQSVDYEWWTTSTPLEEPLADNPDPELRDPWNWKNGRLRWTSANGGTLQMNGTWDKWFRGEAGKISINWDYQIALENLWDRMTPQTTRMQVDFGSTTYNWDIMQDTHPDPAPNQPSAGDAEVAKLCFHAGLSVEMSYGFGLSMPRADTLGALKSYFRYDSDAASSYWGTASMEDVREEIRWLRPVLFDACGDAGCHTWIIYGYKEATDQFMMNFGWDNGSDGWYTHDSIDCLGNDGKPDFDRDQVHHTRIAPRDVVRFVGGSDPGDGSPDDPHQSIDEALAGCPDGSTLIFKAGSTHTLTGGSKVIDQPVTLKGYDVTIQ